MMGDDHGRIAAASKLAAKQVGCKVFKGSPYYRKEGARVHCSAPSCQKTWKIAAKSASTSCS